MSIEKLIMNMKEKKVAYIPNLNFTIILEALKTEWLSISLQKKEKMAI